MNEAETCRTLVRPKLEAAGWDGNRHSCSEQTAFPFEVLKAVVVQNCKEMFNMS